MKGIKRLIIVFIAVAICTNLTNAQSLKDLLGKVGNSGSGSTVGNVLQGLFSSSNISVEDMTGVWKAEGSAVCFQGEGFLKQAGGAAASATIKKKLDPYYQKYGLTGAVLTIRPDGKFELKIKKVTLKGTILQSDEKGIFYFKFEVFNKVNLGKVKTYVQKTSRTMDVMFDATKLMQIVSTVGKATNISVANTFANLLSQYKGLCVGFSTNLTQNITTN